jgi:hypothetical protein
MQDVQLHGVHMAVDTLHTEDNKQKKTAACCLVLEHDNRADPQRLAPTHPRSHQTHHHTPHQVQLRRHQPSRVQQEETRNQGRSVAAQRDAGHSRGHAHYTAAPQEAIRGLSTLRDGELCTWHVHLQHCRPDKQADHGSNAQAGQDAPAGVGFEVEGRRRWLRQLIWPHGVATGC